jgi:predicted ferric reductase
MSWCTGGLLALLLAVAVVLARMASDPATGTSAWDASRAAGFVSYGLLWMSTLSGTWLHLRIRLPAASFSALLELHRASSVLAGTFLVPHVLALLLDTVRFDPIDGFLPFTTSYRPLPVGLGVLSAWLLAAVLLETALAPRLSRRTWKLIHLASYPCYGAALIHGLASGTDSQALSALAFYAVTAASIAAVGAARIPGRGWAD